MDHQVVIDELRGPRGVRENASNRASCQVDVLGTVGLEPVVHACLIAQIELLARGGQHLPGTRTIQAPQDRGTHQPAVAGNEDSRVLIHVGCSLRLLWGDSA